MEIEFGQLDFLAGNQSFDIMIELFAIQGMDMLKIQITLFVEGIIIPINKVIIQLQWERVQTMEVLIVVIEAEVLKKTGLPWTNALKLSLLVNLVSFGIGLLLPF